ncbi:MAG: YIP1 family protein [Candidatus Krumholzibacteria bacterium]|jgi:hypothetical protein|nr:YIP1 family protein [Candidatus Krumholzibacteria bacterium]
MNDAPNQTPAASASLIDRAVQVIVAPAAAMRAVVDRPAWLAPLGVICLLVWLFTAFNVHIMMPESVERQLAHAPAAQVEMLERQLDMFSDPPPWLRLLTGLGAGLSAVLAILLPGLVLHLFLRLSEGKGKLRQTLGVVSWAGLIAYGLRTVLSWAIVAATGSGTYAGLTAASLMPEANPSSVPFVVAGIYGDPFIYWMLWVVLIGVILVHQLPRSRALIVVAATYVLLSIVPIAFTLLGQAVGGH